MTGLLGESKLAPTYNRRAMTGPVPYYDVIREMRNAYNHRLRLVAHARQHGIKAAARVFQAAPATVRKWLRRYQAAGLQGLQALSRAPHWCPHQIAGEREERILELRRHQGPLRYPALLAPDAGPPLARRPVHRP